MSSIKPRNVLGNFTKQVRRNSDFDFRDSAEFCSGGFLPVAKLLERVHLQDRVVGSVPIERHHRCAWWVVA